MEGIGAKRTMVCLMVLAMVVLAQGRAEVGFNPTADTGHCISKCGLKCMFRIIPSKIALCFGLCMIACKVQPSEVVYNCTSGCAHSMVKAYNPTAAEAGKVESFVGSCYETCKRNNINN